LEFEDGIKSAFLQSTPAIKLPRAHKGDLDLDCHKFRTYITYTSIPSGNLSTIFANFRLACASWWSLERVETERDGAKVDEEYLIFNFSAMCSMLW
jgi:hypothetical protein